MAAPVPGSVLIIDDDPRLLASMRRATEGLKPRMRFASSGTQAWHMVQTEVPEVIISDYGLPDMDGVTLLERIRVRHPAVKRILHTAQPILQAGQGHDIPVLGKPCTTEELRALLLAVTSCPG